MAEDKSLITDPDYKETPKDTIKFEPLEDPAPKFEGNFKAFTQERSLHSDMNIAFDMDKFTPYTGELINPDVQKNLEKLRAENQGTMEQAGRAIVQFGLGEVVGGAIEATGYIAELLDMDSSLYGGNDGYSNALTELGTGLKNWTKEEYAIYETAPGEFAPFNASWWMANAPTIGTMFALMLPSGLASMGVKKGAQLLGRALSKTDDVVKASKKLSNLSKYGKVSPGKQQAFNALKATDNYEKLGILSQAGFSRLAEGQMEAQGFWESKFEERYNALIAEGIDEKTAEEMAKETASVGARDIFKKNWLLMAMDIPQYGIFRGLAKGRGPTKLTKAGAKSAGSTKFEIFKDMAREGTEEAIQYAISEEADYLADRSAGIVDERTGRERISSWDTGELATSAFFGALGSGVMQGAGAAYGRFNGIRDKGIDPRDNPEPPQDPSDTPDTPDSPDDQGPSGNDPDAPAYFVEKNAIGEIFYEGLNNISDPDVTVDVLEELAVSKAIQSAKEGTIDSNTQLLDAMLNADESELRQQLNEGMEPYVFEEGEKELIKGAWDTALEEYNNTVDKYGNYAEKIARSNAKKKIYRANSDRYKSKVDEQLAEFPNYEKLDSSYGKPLLDLRVERKGLGEAIKTVNSMKPSPRTKAIKDRMSERVQEINNEINQIEKKDVKTDIRKRDKNILKGSKSLIEDTASISKKAYLSEQTSNYYGEESDNAIKQYEQSQKKGETESGKKTYTSEELKKIKDAHISKAMFSDNYVDNGDGTFTVGELQLVGNEVEPGPGQFKIPGKSTENIREDLANNNDEFLTKVMETLNTTFVPLYNTIAEKQEEADPTVKRKYDLASEKVSDYKIDNEKGDLEAGDLFTTNRDNGKKLYVYDGRNEDGSHNYLSLDESSQYTMTHDAYRAAIPMMKMGEKAETEIDPSEKDFNYQGATTTELNARKKNTAWSGAWKSSNSSEREAQSDEATEVDDVTTNYLESGVAIPDGVYGEVVVETADIDKLTEEQIANNAPIKVVLKRADGRPVSNEGEVRVYVHLPSFAENIEVPKGISKEEFIEEEKQRIREKRAWIAKQIKAGKEVRIPIDGKTAGVINFRRKEGNNHRDFFNLREVFEGDIPIAIMDNASTFIKGTKVHPEFADILGNPTQKGRPYTIAYDANGQKRAVPLDKQNLTEEEANVVYQLISHLISNKNNNNVLGNDVKTLMSETRLTTLLDIYPNMTYMELFNHLVYESEKTKAKDSNQVFHLEFKKKDGTGGILYLSGKNGKREMYSYMDISNKADEIKEALRSHYRNVNVKELTNDEYKNYLIDEDIIQAQYQKQDLFVQPVVKFGEEHIVEDTGLPHEENEYGFMRGGVPDGVETTPATESDLFGDIPFPEEAGETGTSDYASSQIEQMVKDRDSAINTYLDAYFNSTERPNVQEAVDTIKGFEDDAYIDFAVERLIDTEFIAEESGEQGMPSFGEEGSAPPRQEVLDFREKVYNELGASKKPYGQMTEEEVREANIQQEDIDPTEGFDDAPFQKKDLAGRVEKGLIPILDNLALRTGIDYVIVDDKDLNWSGRNKDGKIYVNLAYASLDTPFHEFLHPVFRQIKLESPITYNNLLNQARTTDEFNIILDSVRGNNPSYSNEMVLEEALVQITGELAAGNIKDQRTKGIIQKIWNAIQRFFQKLMPGVDISKINTNITLQEIADIMTSNSFVSVAKNPMLGYHKVNGSAKRFDDWVNLMMYSVITKNDVALNDITNPEDLDYSSIGSLLSYYKKNAKTDAQKDAVEQVISEIFKKDEYGMFIKEAAEDIKGNILRNKNGDPIMRAVIDTDSVYVNAIQEKIKKFGTFNPLDGQEDLFTEETDEDSINRMRNIKDGYEINHKDKVSEDVRFMLSFIPKLGEDGNPVFNSQSGLVEFHSFNDIWNTLIAELADVEATQEEDLYNVYLNKIAEIAKFRPEFNKVLAKIKEAKDNDRSNAFKQRFVRTFNLADQNFITMLKTGGKYQIIEKNPQGAEFQIKNEWKNNIIENMIDYSNPNELKLKKGLVAPIKQMRSKLVATYRSNAGLSTPSESMVSDMIDYLDAFGIHMTPRQMNKYFADSQSKMAGYNKLIQKSNFWIENLENLSDKTIDDNTAWFTDNEEGSILPLAKAVGFFNQDLTDNSILGPQGKTYYNYSIPTVMHKRINEWKKDPTYLNQLAQHEFYRTSRWRDHILNGEDFDVMNMINYKSMYDKGNRPKSITFGDRLAQSFNSTLMGYFALHARGSNSTEFFIKGPEVIQAYSVVDNDVFLTTEAVDIMTEYAIDEFIRIQKEQQHLDNGGVKIDGYHTEVNGIIPALQMQSFPALRGSKLLFKEGRPTNATPAEIMKSGEVRDLIKRNLKTNFNSTRRMLQSAGLIDDSFQPEGISIDLYNSYANSIDGTGITPNEKRKRTVDGMVIDYVINSMVANKEQQKLFTGDPALYGSQSNLQKRIIAGATGGYAAYIDPTDDAFNMNSAIISDVEIASIAQDYFEEMGITGYDKVDLADAQSWVTWDTYKRLLRAYGKWEPDYNQIEDAIDKGKDLNDSQRAMLAEIIDKSTFTNQPLKNVSGDLVVEPGMTPRFVYDKQTILPIIPRFANSDMQKLLDIMDANKVDHLSVKSGVKLGALEAVTIHDPETGEILDVADAPKLNVYKQSVKYMFLQQDLPKKGIGPILESSQMKHNIYVDLKEGQKFGKFERDEIIAEIHKIHGALSDKGIENIKSEIFKDGKLNVARLNSVLSDMMTQRQVDDLLTDALAAGMPIEAIPTHNVLIQQNLASMINSRAVKVKHGTGLAAIQVSSFGFVNRFSKMSREQKDGIIWLTDEKKLTPPKLVDGKLHPGSLLVPYQLYKKYPDILDNPELARELMQGVDYRIPNQARSSIGFVEVAGILPPEMGDSAVVYDAVTKKTGSDFDVDKMNIMFYNLYENRPEKVKFHDVKATEQNLREVFRDQNDSYQMMDGREVISSKDTIKEDKFVAKYLGTSPYEFNSKEAIENRKLDVYMMILSNEDAYKDMMETLDSNEVRDIADTPDNAEYDFSQAFNPLNGFYQALMREQFVDANSAVGIVANAIVDHPQAQAGDLYLQKKDKKGRLVPYYIGNGPFIEINGKKASVISKSDNKQISKILKELMNSQVDAEKDPWGSLANINMTTIGPIIAMSRMGIDLKMIFDIVKNPLVREYVQAKKNMSTTFAFSTKSIEEQAFERFFKVKEDIAEAVEKYEKTPVSSNPRTALEKLKYFQEIERINGQISKSVRASKFTANGMGKTVFDAISVMLQKDTVEIGNFERKFTMENGTPTMEQKYFENSVGFFMETFGNKMISTTPAFIGSLNVVDGVFAGGLLQSFEQTQGISLDDSANIQEIYQAFYSYAISQAMEVDLQDLIGKENSVAKDVAKYKDQNDNPLINMLQVTYGTKFDTVSFPNGIKLSEEGRAQMHQAWKDLHRNDPAFSKRLAQYAYASSGFKFGLNSFYQFMPVEVMNAFNIRETVESIIKQGQEPGEFSQAFNQMVKNNYKNSSLVPQASKNDFQNINGKMTLVSEKRKFKDAPSYVTYKVRNKGKTTYTLWELQDIDEKTYTRTNTLGQQENGFNFVEYNVDNIMIDSFFDDTKGKKAPIAEAKQQAKKNETTPELHQRQTPSESTSQRFYEGDITPSENTVFVFGSNPVGINGLLKGETYKGSVRTKDSGGAAAVARREFGVKASEKMNNKLSDSGKAYGLVTVSYPGKKKSKSPKEITQGITKLYETAKANPDKQFKVAYRNTNKASLNGYTGLEMIEMFNKAGNIPSNIIFSKEWYDTGKLNISQADASEYGGTIEVDQFKITRKDDGLYFQNGNKIEDQTIINKYEVKEAKNAGWFSKFKFNKTDYAAIVSFDGQFKMVSLSKTNTGGEVFKEGSPQRDAIIDSAPGVTDLYKKYCNKG